MEKLRSLQSDYIRLIEDEDPRHVEVLQEYLDLVSASFRENILQLFTKFKAWIISQDWFPLTLGWIVIFKVSTKKKFLRHRLYVTANKIVIPKSTLQETVKSF